MSPHVDDPSPAATDAVYATRPGELPTPITDPSVGQWLVDRLGSWGPAGVPAGGVVPRGFDAVARVLHPAGGLRWAEIAARRGTVLHPLAQWHSIAPDRDTGVRDGSVDPDEGNCPPEVLAAILDHCPAGADGVIQAVWVGFGIWHPTPDETHALHAPGRSYHLFRTPKRVVSRWFSSQSPEWGQSANLVWPDDHTWCIATEIDWDFTLVAGSRELVDAVLADPRLEAFQVGYDDDLSWYGDHLNPLPPGLTRPDPA